MTSEGHIYKIICTLDETFCYIGSTFNRLSKRFEKHRDNYYAWKKGKPKTFCSCFSYFDKYGINNFKIILIKSYNVCRTHNKDRRHLEAYETLWINKSKCVNKILPISYLQKERKKQYYQNNRTKFCEINKEWREKNKDKVIEYSKEWREKNKEYGIEWREKNKEYEKEWSEKNKDKISKRKKEYYQKNKSIKVSCPHCDKEMTKGALTKHIKTYCKNK